MPAMPKKAAALIIGNELLSGKIQEQNLAFLGKELYRLGVRLTRAVVVLDDVDTIADELNLLRGQFDYVFTSGGVGPTHDDMTLQAIAKAFGRPLARAEAIETLIRGYHGDKVTEAHLRMADLPQGARLLSSDAMPWPTITVDNVFVFPGVPEIFRLKFDALRSHLSGGAPFYSRAVYTRCDEGTIAGLLSRLEQRFEGVSVGSYPTFRDTDYRTKVTFDGQHPETLTDIVRAFTAAIAPGLIVRIE